MNGYFFIEDHLLMTQEDPKGVSKPLPVFDVNMACAYYACVFDALLEGELASSETRHMRIGHRRYLLVHDKASPSDTVQYDAPVEDVDLSIARVVTRGGKIVSHADTNPDGQRQGCVRDPFGHVWVVTGH
jgi:uncharacterized glyoxalase superfamily protein PhnB